jgi:hypothetical protein
MIAHLLLTLLSTTTASHGFIAYDCSGPKLNITSFNSLQVDYCEKPPPQQSIKLQRIKLIQRAETRSIQYKSCLISIDFLITKCSTFDDAQAVEGGFFSEISIIGSARCAELHQTLSYRFPSGEMLLGLQINSSRSVSHTITGNIDRDGNCQGNTFSSDRGTWKNVVVQGNYKITLSDGIATTISKDNSIILPTGSRHKLTNLYGIDPYKGEVIWSIDHQSQNCDSGEFDLLYDGPATIMMSEQAHPTSEQTQTFLVESENIVFALKRVKKTLVCEIPVIQTEHPQLYVLTDMSFMNHFNTKNISPQNTNLMAYVNTKFVYIENYLKTNLVELYSDLLMKQCELERKMLIHKLSLASFSLSEFAYQMGEGPGYISIKAGEIIYLLKCKPVNVEILPQKACFDELSVNYNNKSYYMAPKTHTLQTHGTQTDCNHLLPTAFSLDGDWFGISPEIREIKKPQSLKPSTTWTWNYKSPEQLLTAGIYSYETMNALQKHLLLPQEIESAQKNIARQSMGFNYIDQGLRLQSLIDEQSISNIVENKLYKMWGWFTIFGNVISGLLGILFIWKIIITIINTGLNLTLLYQTFGWSIKLIAGAFNSVTQYIMHKAHKKQFKNNDETATKIKNPQNSESTESIWIKPTPMQPLRKTQSFSKQSNSNATNLK